MGLFSFFKREQQDDLPKEKYWSLTTNDGEVIAPTWEQVKVAVENATPDGTVFASLGYMNSGLELEMIQVVGENDLYRFEALPQDGRIFVQDSISLEETLKLFEEFYQHKKVAGYRSWQVEK